METCMRNIYDDFHATNENVYKAANDSTATRLLSTLMLVGLLITLAVGVWALDKAGRMQSDNSLANTTVQQTKP